MNGEQEILYRRFIELSEKSATKNYYTFTDFLGLSEQSIFFDAKPNLKSLAYKAFGGDERCERVMIRFGDPDELGYEEPFPISIIKIQPKSAKFADKLTHRDFLGAILNLGIERSTLGDILIIENCGYLFAKSDIADYIASSLERIKHTDIRCAIVDSIPEGITFVTEVKRIMLSGERLDAVVAKTYSLSREDAQSLFKKRLIFVNGKCTENTSYTPKADEIISVRGHGRFIYRGVVGTSKKSKLNAEVEVYI